MRDNYIDLALTSEEMEARQSINTPLADAPRYPYGLSISLDHVTLEKLGALHDNWDVGEQIPLDVIVEVTGKNVNKTESGAQVCINLQIIAIKPEEHEAETEEFEQDPPLGKHGYLNYSS